MIWLNKLSLSTHLLGIMSKGILSMHTCHCNPMLHRQSLMHLIPQASNFIALLIEGQKPDREPGLSSSDVPAAGLPGIEPVVLTASLKHHFEAVGGNIVQITFEDTEIKVTGGLGGLLVGLPPLPPPPPPHLLGCT